MARVLTHRPLARRMAAVPRPVRWIAAVVAAVVVLALAASALIDEPLRRYVEAKVNARLDGYTLRIEELDLHPWGFSLHLKGASLVQDAHPDPPVAYLPKLSASLQWKAVFFRRLVANFEFVEPRVYVNREHLQKEAEDEVPVEERGWQEALEAIYFDLKINEFKVVNGDVTYVDEGPFKPLRLSRVNLVAENIRNVRSPERVYPSEVRLDAVVFESGSVVVDGSADFLADPHPGVKAAVRLDGVELDYFRPILARYNLAVRKGTLSAAGLLEYAPTVRMADLERVVVQSPEADWIHTARTETREKQMARKTAETAKAVSGHPEIVLRVGELRVVNGDFGFVNKSARPEYRVFLSRTDITLTGVSNQPGGRAEGTLRGQFMGSGNTTAALSFHPQARSPDLEYRLAIVNTRVPAMNNVLRAHGKFDVVEGFFSFYSEATVRNGRINGYAKPLFRELDVYDPAQDEEKSVGRKLYEKIVGAVARILENLPRDEVATRADISGPLEDPNASAFQVVIRLIQNAFFKAILPGFDREAGRARRARS